MRKLLLIGVEVDLDEDTYYGKSNRQIVEIYDGNEAMLYDDVTESNSWEAIAVFDVKEKADADTTGTTE